MEDESKQRLDELYKEQFRLIIARDFCRSQGGRSERNAALEYEFNVISDKLAAIKAPRRLRDKLRPDSYEEFAQELDKLQNFCPDCVYLDRSSEKLDSVQYFCLAKHKLGTSVIEDIGTCLDHKKIDISQANPVNDILESQILIARELIERMKARG